MQLVKRTIREVKPQVVMLELDAENIFLLPEGEAKQVRSVLFLCMLSLRKQVGFTGVWFSIYFV